MTAPKKVRLARAVGGQMCDFGDPDSTPYIRADAPELVALADALRKCRDDLHSFTHNEFDGVWDESDFVKLLGPYDAALAAFEALRNDP